MKSVSMIVPKNLVKNHLPHPEYYGESIVELENGMFTDVYTDEVGELYSITNNQELIRYLQSSESQPKQTVLEVDNVQLRSVTFDDFSLIHQWLTMSPYHRYDLLENSEELALKYISHAKTIFSDVLKISTKKPLGVIGYQIIDKTLIMNLDSFRHDALFEIDSEKIIRFMCQYLKSVYTIDNLYFKVFEDDEGLNRILLEMSGNKKPIPTIKNGFLLNFTEKIYELKI